MTGNTVSNGPFNSYLLTSIPSYVLSYECSAPGYLMTLGIGEIMNHDFLPSLESIDIYYREVALGAQ